MALVCHCDMHHKCRLTRSVLASAHPSREGQSRPVGLQASWLLHADQLDTAHDHVRMGPPSWAERAAAKEWLVRIESAAALFEVERPARVGGLEEPVVVP